MNALFVLRLCGHYFHYLTKCNVTKGARVLTSQIMAIAIAMVRIFCQKNTITGFELNKYVVV